MTTFAKSLRVHPPAKSAPTLHASLASKTKSSHESRSKSKSLSTSDHPSAPAPHSSPPPLPLPPPPPLMQSGTLESSGAQLQELCPEDKARVARLIQQLVHVGSEHEKAVEKWGEERQAMEARLQRLREQNEALVKETAAVRSKFGATLSLVSQYQERLLGMRNTRDEALIEANEAKNEAKNATDRAERAGDSISALESRVHELESALESALSAHRSQDRNAELVKLGQIEACRSEPTANARSVKTTATSEAAFASRRGKTASAALSVQPCLNEVRNDTILVPAKVDSSLEVDASLLKSAEIRTVAVFSPMNREVQVPRSTHDTLDLPVDPRRSVEFEDNGVDADISLLLSEQLPPDFELSRRGTASRRSPGRTLGGEALPPPASTPQSAAPSQPAFAHMTNAQALPQQEVFKCQEDNARGAISPPYPNSIAKSLTSSMGYGYGADLFDLLDELESTSVGNS